MSSQDPQNHQNPHNSIQTNVWGPILWSYFHIWSKSFPVHPTPKQKFRFARTFLAVLDTLPCNICVDNVPSNLCKMGFAKPHTPKRLAAMSFLDSRQTFTRFLFDFHNKVSEMLGKETKHRTYAQTMNQLEMTRATACQKRKRKDGEKGEKGENGENGEENGCTEPQYKACKTVVTILPRNQLQGGAKGKESNFQISRNL